MRHDDPSPRVVLVDGSHHNNVDARAPAGTCHLVVCTRSQVGCFVRFDDMFIYRSSHASAVHAARSEFCRSAVPWSQCRI